MKNCNFKVAELSLHTNVIYVNDFIIIRFLSSLIQQLIGPFN